ncbi:MAG TPA: Crp/Fnr family transcriptional regulator [Myxococcota bacterium]|nr:Crp/Fnr family transcriptional regulator [Myxococcota bacterium]
MDAYWHVRNVDWMGSLAPDESELLKRESTSRSYAPGEMIFAPTANPSAVYLLEQGLVRIYRLSETGAEVTFGYVSPGEVFGELALFGVPARESFAESVIRSTVRKIPRAVFTRLLEARPAMVLAVTKQIGERMRRIESRVEHLVFRDVKSRVARILLELAEDFGRPEVDGILIEIPLTQGELATLVGSVRQTVNDALRQFEQAGWIRQLGRQLLIVKRDELQRLTQRTPT